jgi:hypothetical protein
MRSHAVWSLALVIVAFRADVSLQTPSTAMPQVRILSPREDAFVSGPTRLRAGVEPPNIVSSVVFFVDGRQVCSDETAVRMRMGCGATFRIQVPSLCTTRVGASCRTRDQGIGFAETLTSTWVGDRRRPDDHGHHVKGLPGRRFMAEDGRPQAISRHFYSEDMPLEPWSPST